MSGPTDNSGTREKRIEELLLLIAGCESALAAASEDEHQFKSQLNKMVKGYIEKLRRVIRGLPEED